MRSTTVPSTADYRCGFTASPCSSGIIMPQLSRACQYRCLALLHTLRRYPYFLCPSYTWPGRIIPDTSSWCSFETPSKSHIYIIVFPSTSNHTLSHFASTSDNATGACEDEAMGKSEMERTQPQGPRNCRQASILTCNSSNPVAAFVLSDPCASPSISWKVRRRLSKPSNQLFQAPLPCHTTSLRKFSCLGVMLCDII